MGVTALQIEGHQGGVIPKEEDTGLNLVMVGYQPADFQQVLQLQAQGLEKFPPSCHNCKGTESGLDLKIRQGSESLPPGSGLSPRLE